jgi:hypothetical protein
LINTTQAGFDHRESGLDQENWPDNEEQQAD